MKDIACGNLPWVSMRHARIPFRTLAAHLSWYLLGDRKSCPASRDASPSTVKEGNTLESRVSVMAERRGDGYRRALRMNDAEEAARIG